MAAALLATAGIGGAGSGGISLLDFVVWMGLVLAARFVRVLIRGGDADDYGYV